jgi:hypothetical protein
VAGPAAFPVCVGGLPLSCWGDALKTPRKTVAPDTTTTNAATVALDMLAPG